MPSASNKYFDESAPVPEHPRIRAWRSYKNQPAVNHVELEIRRQREGLTYLPTRMFVTFYDPAGAILRQDEAEWELELDSWLLKEHVKAKDEDNEKLRFALRLKAASGRSQSGSGMATSTRSWSTCYVAVLSVAVSRSHKY